MPAARDKGDRRMTAQIHSLYTETTPLIGGSYKITYYRNAKGACSKKDASEAIVHYYSLDGVLVHCEYIKLGDDAEH